MYKSLRRTPSLQPNTHVAAPPSPHRVLRKFITASPSKRSRLGHQNYCPRRCCRAQRQNQRQNRNRKPRNGRWRGARVRCPKMGWRIQEEGGEARRHLRHLDRGRQWRRCQLLLVLKLLRIQSRHEQELRPRIWIRLCHQITHHKLIHSPAHRRDP